jgi:hypothetical protein
MDMFGKQILNQNIFKTTEEINLKNIQSGLYMIIIESNGNRSETKLTIVK